ncbi:ABC transporter substrate-binding protein [Bacillaceae bacterium IKA-2]|nr:ABC transporter substrate-binding protein [Bacillaceae bacterium IKA-2]
MNFVFLKKWGLLAFVLLLSMAIFVGCGQQDQEQSAQGEENSTEEGTNDDNEELAEKSEELFPVTFTDDGGREVTIETEPQSIVSIQASNTEMVFALGLGDKVIGVSDYCNYPAEVLEIQQVGAQDINVELILTLLPDVVLVTDYHFNNYPEILANFEEAGIKVIVTGSASSFADVYSMIEMIATATGSQVNGEEIISDMKQRLSVIKEKAAAVTNKKTVWVEVSPAPDIFTTGKNTFMHEMLESIQAINAAEAQDGWVSLTEEEIVKLDPEVVITTYGYYVDNPREEVLNRDGWAEVPAVKNEQVFDVDSDTVTRPGPRLIEGVETLADFIYPEIFK